MSPPARATEQWPSYLRDEMSLAEARGGQSQDVEDEFAGVHIGEATLNQFLVILLRQR